MSFFPPTPFDDNTLYKNPRPLSESRFAKLHHDLLTLLAGSCPWGFDGEVLTVRCQRTVPPSDPIVNWTKSAYMTRGQYKEFQGTSEHLLYVFRTYFDYDFPGIIPPDPVGYNRSTSFVIDVGGDRSILLTQRSGNAEPLATGLTRRVTNYIVFGNQTDDSKFAEACREARTSGRHASIVGYADIPVSSASDFEYIDSGIATDVYTQQSYFNSDNSGMERQADQVYPPSQYEMQPVDYSEQQTGWVDSTVPSGFMGPPFYPSDYRTQ